MKWATLLVVSVAVCAGAAAQSVEAVRLSPFSGEPVPRFVSLRHAAAHGRVGPSLESPIAWEYARQGLPVEVIKESGEWRRIRDPAGDEAWIHRSQISEAPTVMATLDAALLAEPAADARQLAVIEAGAVLRRGECDAAYCAVRSGRFKGWTAREALWGAPAAAAAETGL